MEVDDMLANFQNRLDLKDIDQDAMIETIKDIETYLNH